MKQELKKVDPETTEKQGTAFDRMPFHISGVHVEHIPALRGMQEL